MPIVASEEVLRSFIRLILVQVWDPIGIKRFGIAISAVVDDSDDDMLVVALEPLQHREPISGDFESEYDSYIPTIQSMILTGEPIDVIFDYLRMIETEFMEREGNQGITLNAAQRLHFIGTGCRLPVAPVR